MFSRHKQEPDYVESLRNCPQCQRRPVGLHWHESRNSDGYYVELVGLPLDAGHDLWANSRSLTRSKRVVLEKLKKWRFDISQFIIEQQAELDKESST